MLGYKIRNITQTDPKRVIYFPGNPLLSEKSPTSDKLDTITNNQSIDFTNKLITRVCADYQTIPGLVNWVANGISRCDWFALECASRTLSNLYNLYTCRGIINQDKWLELDSSLTGPHHYLGHIDPRDFITIHIPPQILSHQTLGTKTEYGLPIYTSYSTDNIPSATALHVSAGIKLKTKIPDEKIITLQNYKWIPGSDISSNIRKRFRMMETQESANRLLINTRTGLQTNSIFPYPGILELSETEIRFQIINPDPHTNGGIEYDFSPFGAQLVLNEKPWQFNQAGIQGNRQAQHKLRLITFYYGSRYVPDYLMRSRKHPQGQGSGLSIKRHEFIKAITPINPDCGGFVILGQELKTWTGRKIGLELIGVRIPFGYTILVEPWTIHGDSNLTGLYSIAMTGNHLALATADTVFLKNNNTGNNVRIVDASETQYNNTSKQPPRGQQKLLITSDNLTPDELAHETNNLLMHIRAKINWLESLYYNPVI